MAGRCRSLAAGVLLAAACLWAAPAWAGVVVFSESFDGPDLPDTLTYSAPTGHAWSIDASNQLFDDFDGTANTSVRAITKAGFTDPSLPVVYSLDTGKPQGAAPGSYNVGMHFGGYTALFHPGYGGGAFRMGGGFSQSNLNMGFTPAQGVLHHMEAQTVMSGGNLLVNVSITGLGTDGLDHEFNYFFVDSTPNINTGTFGAHRSGAGNEVSDAFFDNFQAEILPEPASLALLGAALLPLLRRRKR